MTQFKTHTLAIAYAAAFFLSCSGDGGGGNNSPSSSSAIKEGCIAAELAIKANTLDDVTVACNASRSEVLSQLPSSIGSCSKTDLDFDKPIKEVMEACGIDEIPTVSSSSNGSSSGGFSSNGNSSSSGSSSSSGNTADSCPPQYGIQDILDNCTTDLYPYCYGYSTYKDCNLIGGKWIQDASRCALGGGLFVNANYCNKNGIKIDDTPWEESSGTFVDDRDNKGYMWVRINGKIWMRENLNYNASGSVCYDYLESNCDRYGRLYDWATAMNACPAGWHLPSFAEFGYELDLNYFPGNSGYFDASTGFRFIREYGGWWTASERNATDASYRHVGSFDRYEYGGSWIEPGNRYYKGHKFSVHCVKD